MILKTGCALGRMFQETTLTGKGNRDLRLTLGPVPMWIIPKIPLKVSKEHL